VCPRITKALKSLLRREGYSDNAAKEVLKWYKPPAKRKKSKAVKKWHAKAMLIDFKKTKITILYSDIDKR
jgi:hypothetical protein